MLRQRGRVTTMRYTVTPAGLAAALNRRTLGITIDEDREPRLRAAVARWDGQDGPPVVCDLCAGRHLPAEHVPAVA
jgi:hypothetical protein